MLIFDSRVVGNKLLAIRKRMGLTQMQVAEAAELSDRAYADIERGTVNMRMDTILRICRALHVTPDEIFTEADEPADVRQEELARAARGLLGPVTGRPRWSCSPFFCAPLTAESITPAPAMQQVPGYFYTDAVCGARVQSAITQ